MTTGIAGGDERERGVSEVVGLVLLFGIVMAGAALILMSSSAFQGDVQDQNRMKSATTAMQEVDSRLSTLSYQTDLNLTDVDFPITQEAGEVTVMPNSTRVAFVLNGAEGRRAGCTASVSLGSIRYNATDDASIAYEAGGVWRHSDGRTRMVTPPDLEFRNGSITFDADDIQGEAAGTGGLFARKSFQESKSKTDDLEQNLLSPYDGCSLRTNLTIKVRSTYHEAWSRYFESNFPDSTEVTDFDGNDTVVVFLKEETLARFDSDGDGVVDEADNCPETYNPAQHDPDNDGDGDACDDDNDGDGHDDVDDNCKKEKNKAQVDWDGDDVGNRCEDSADPSDWEGDGVPLRKDNCRVKHYNPNQSNVDNDSRGDRCDIDIDDARDPGKAGNHPSEPMNGKDNCPFVWNPNQRNNDVRPNGTPTERGNACDPDDDGDLFYDNVSADSKLYPINKAEWKGKDNCPYTANPAQKDSDGDGVGNKCETSANGDYDGDGVKNSKDNCPRVSNPGQDDLDGQGRGDKCDTDDDGDGYKDPAETGPGETEDNCPRKWNPGQDDTDKSGDGGDACDSDDDGDTVPDDKDNCPKTANAGQKDSDGDHRGDACDTPATLPPHNASFVNVQSIDPSGYRNVSIYATVNTRDGKAGALTAADFRVFENKAERPISVKFTKNTAVDVVFVFDDTGSMGGPIRELKNNARSFANDLESAGIDARYSLMSFKNDWEIDQALTSDVDEFKNAVDALSAGGGGDGPEDSLDSIWKASQMNFRPGAQKVIVHITDVRSGHNSHRVPEVANALNDIGATFYTFSPRSAPQVREVARRVDGNWINFDDSKDFGAVLDDVKEDLTNRYKITFRTCLPGDGASRAVYLYANASDGRIGRGQGNYTAPNTGGANTCSGGAPPDPGPPKPDPLPDPAAPPFSGGKATDTDEPHPKVLTAKKPWSWKCDRDDTESWSDWGGTPPEPWKIPDDDGNADYPGTRKYTVVVDQGCYPSEPPDWGQGNRPDPYTNVININVDIVEMDDEEFE